MRYVLSLIGIIGSLFMLKYRERIGEMMGEAEWMRKVGGVYTVVVIIAVFIFFWSIAELTGTTGIFFRPLLFFLPGIRENNPQQDFIID